MDADKKNKKKGGVASAKGDKCAACHEVSQRASVMLVSETSFHGSVATVRGDVKARHSSRIRCYVLPQTSFFGRISLLTHTHTHPCAQLRVFRMCVWVRNGGDAAIAIRLDVKWNAFRSPALRLN
jgi:hypothetical protein